MGFAGGTFAGFAVESAGDVLAGARAVELQNGVWVLPRTEEHVLLVTRLADATHEQGGSAFMLTAAAGEESTDAEIVQRFWADRARECDDFVERCAELLSEIDKETRRAKPTCAELEEVDQDLERFTGWLGKITRRYFFPDERTAAAADRLRRCQEALDGCARAVYDTEGLSDASGSEDEPETPGRAAS